MAPFTVAVLDSGHQFDGAKFFHYTTLANFRSICASRSLWMGRCLDTNDTEEVSFAVEVIDSHIRDHYAAHPASKKVRAALDGLVRSIPTDIFFASFTTNPDLLSQWRGYAAKEGVSFGFSRKHILSLSVSFGLKFAPVEYDYKKQIGLVDRIVRSMLEAFSSDEADSARLRSQAFEQFIRISPFLKHGAFSEECEWRLIHIPDGTTRLSPQSKKIGGIDRRIIELPIEPKLFVPSFIFGSIFTSPALSTDGGFRNVEEVLNGSNLSAYHIQMSSIPYQRSKF